MEACPRGGRTEGRDEAPLGDLTHLADLNPAGEKNTPETESFAKRKTNRQNVAQAREERMAQGPSDLKLENPYPE